MRLVIEDIAPLIRKRKAGRPPAYPFAALREVGQGFFVPESKTAYVNVYLATYRTNKRSEKQYTCRKEHRGGEVGGYVQRVK